MVMINFIIMVVTSTIIQFVFNSSVLVSKCGKECVSVGASI